MQQFAGQSCIVTTSSRVCGANFSPAALAPPLQAIKMNKAKLVLVVQTSWLTPSEIFRPFWGEAIAAYIAEQADRADAGLLNIIEIGGGETPSGMT